MTPLFTLTTLVLGFSLGYLFRGRVLEKVSVFSKQDAKKGREAIARRIQKRKARIMEYAQAKGKVTNDDVEDLFCISDHTARNYLNKLIYT